MGSIKKMLCLAAAVLAAALGGCTGGEIKLDPENPVTVSVWHYYNGAVLNAFEAMVHNFNDTAGAEEGIIVEYYGFGGVNELEEAVIASVNKEIGSMPIPDIFGAYADTAYRAEKLGMLTDLDGYFSKEEQEGYLPSYIEEGRIGLNGELRIFPVAKSTEILVLNDTDWKPFADENGLDYDDLRTMEGIARVSALYYDWTAAQSPDGTGKAFFGRDGTANMFIIASKSFGTELFSVKNGVGTINADRDVMRKIWDCYYVPYISGHYGAYGRFRSDDVKVGDLIAYVGSTSSSSYFPTEVTLGGAEHPVTGKVLPAPGFEGGAPTLVQQGAGMVVSKGTPQSEYASLAFLKWLTESEQNIYFASLSGYMPVKKEALDYELIKAKAGEQGISFSDITDQTLKTALSGIESGELYTSKAFDGGAEARDIIDTHLQSKADADRAEVAAMIEAGSAHAEAMARFDTDEAFEAWLADMTAQLNRAVSQAAAE